MQKTTVVQLSRDPFSLSLAEKGEAAIRTRVSTALHQSWLYGRVARWKPLLRKRNMTVKFAKKRHVKD
jgi:hypothetical protein